MYHRISHGSLIFSRENTSDKRDIPWYTTRERYITILYNAITVPTNSEDISDVTGTVAQYLWLAKSDQKKRNDLTENWRTSNDCRFTYMLDFILKPGGKLEYQDNASPQATDLRILRMFFQHRKWFISLYYSNFIHCTNSDFLIGCFVPCDTGLWRNNLLDVIIVV